jgi:hypothetical protein
MISDSFSLVKSSLPLEVRKAAAYGWKLFPIVAGAKSPLVKWGTTEPASSDLDQITRWAMKYPNSSWGCATGSKSGFFAVDTDDMDGWLWAMSKGLPETHNVKTGKDVPYAYHYYFKQPAGIVIKNSQKKIHSGVDVRGDGGLVVVPPSLHHSGNRYHLEKAHAWELAEAPDWLLELVKDNTPGRPVIDLCDLPPLTPNQTQHGQNIFRKLCRQFAALPAGTGSCCEESRRL